MEQQRTEKDYYTGNLNRHLLTSRTIDYTIKIPTCNSIVKVSNPWRPLMETPLPKDPSLIKHSVAFSDIGKSIVQWLQEFPSYVARLIGAAPRCYILAMVAWPSDNNIFRAIADHYDGCVLIINDGNPENRPGAKTAATRNLARFKQLPRMPKPLGSLLPCTDYELLSVVNLSYAPGGAIQPPGRLWAAGSPRGPFMHIKSLILLADLAPMSIKPSVYPCGVIRGSYNMSGNAQNNLEFCECTFGDHRLANAFTGMFAQVWRLSRCIME